MNDLAGSQKWWERLRHNKVFHIGLGDVRVTIGMQEEVTDRIEELERRVEGRILENDLLRRQRDFKAARIEELEAALKCVKGPNDLRMWELRNIANYALKATEAETMRVRITEKYDDETRVSEGEIPIPKEAAETPDTPSTDDQAPPQSIHARAVEIGVRLDWLLSDFQEHKQEVERSLKTLKAEMDIVAQQSDNVRDRLLALEQRSQGASPDFVYPPLRHEGTSVSTPAFPLSEDKTPAPQHLEGEDLRRFQARPLGTAPLPKDRRSGKERRVLKSVERGHGSHYVGETDLYPNRREIARRLQDRQERWRG